jgi:hypothetical protein
MRLCFVGSDSATPASTKLKTLVSVLVGPAKVSYPDTSYKRDLLHSLRSIAGTVPKSCKR